MRSIVLVNVTQFLDAEALGACSQEKPVNYIVRGGDHLKFLVEQCGGTDSLEGRRKLFSDDELQRWYNLEVNAGEKAGCLLPQLTLYTPLVSYAMSSNPRGTVFARNAASTDQQNQRLFKG